MAGDCADKGNSDSLERFLPVLVCFFLAVGLDSALASAPLRSPRRSLIAVNSRKVLPGRGMLDYESGTVDTSGPSLQAFAVDPNSLVKTDDYAFMADIMSNVSSVRSTHGAFIARISPTEHEPEFESQIAVFSESEAARYVVWGDPSMGGEIETGLTVEEQHFIDLVDVCGTSRAFFGIKDKKVVCVGADADCKGYDTYHSTDYVYPLRILCARDGPVALIEFNDAPSAGQRKIVLVGDDSKYPLPESDKDWIDEWAKVAPGELTTFVVNDNYAAALAAGAQIFMWGGGEAERIDFASDVVANRDGFGVLLTNSKVRTWGDRLSDDVIPEEIRYGGVSGGSVVVSIHGFGSCFAALTSEGGVRTWGNGEEPFCHESGAYSLEGYTNYASVKAQLQSGVELVFGNDHSLLAVKNDSTIATWGRNSAGGSHDPSVVKWANKDMINATLDAYTMLRADGQVEAWGNVYTGAVWLQFGKGAQQIAASDDLFVVLTDLSDLVVYPGASQGWHSADSSLAPQFLLSAVPSRLVSSKAGVVAVLGHDCLYQEWSEWSACTKQCGGGMRERSRSIQEYARNGRCAYEFHGAESCNVQDCPEEAETTDYSLVKSTGFIVSMTLAGAALLVCLCGAFYVFKKRRRAENYDLM